MLYFLWPFFSQDISTWQRKVFDITEATKMYLISGKIPVTNTDTQDGTGWFDTDVYRNI